MSIELLNSTTGSDEIGEINKYDFRTESKPVFRARKGLNAEIVEQISEMKGEPTVTPDMTQHGTHSAERYAHLVAFNIDDFDVTTVSLQARPDFPRYDLLDESDLL